jgi:hypothetical protein
MAYINTDSYTSGWVANYSVPASELNGALDEIVGGLKNGTKTINVATITTPVLTVLSTATFSGNVSCNKLSVTSDMSPSVGSTYALGNTANPWTEISLDHGDTDGGYVYFDDGSVSISTDKAGNVMTITAPTVAFSNALTVTGTTFGSITALCFQGAQYTTTTSGELGTAPYQYVMPRAGKIVGITVFVNASVVTVGGNIAATINVSGTAVHQTANTAVTTTGTFTISETAGTGIEIGDHTFVAGNTISVRLVKLGSTSGTMTAQAIVEVVYDAPTA